MSLQDDFRKHRTRLLVISKDGRLRNDLVTLLTGYGYFVDYVDSRIGGLRKFRETKHAIVIIDVPTLPREPSHFFRSFRVYSRNPIFLIAAKDEEMIKVEPYLKKEVYDIVNIPLKMVYLNFSLKRLVDHMERMRSNEFLKTAIILAALATPIWLVLMYVLFLWWNR